MDCNFKLFYLFNVGENTLNTLFNWYSSLFRNEFRRFVKEVEKTNQMKRKFALQNGLAFIK